jgi:hypothetical protein
MTRAMPTIIDRGSTQASSAAAYPGRWPISYGALIVVRDVFVLVRVGFGTRLWVMVAPQVDLNGCERLLGPGLYGFLSSRTTMDSFRSTEKNDASLEVLRAREARSDAAALVDDADKYDPSATLCCGHRLSACYLLKTGHARRRRRG